jgi:hypothetical protein
MLFGIIPGKTPTETGKMVEGKIAGIAPLHLDTPVKY